MGTHFRRARRRPRWRGWTATGPARTPNCVGAPWLRGRGGEESEGESKRRRELVVVRTARVRGTGSVRARLPQTLRAARRTGDAAVEAGERRRSKRRSVSKRKREDGQGEYRDARRRGTGIASIYTAVRWWYNERPSRSYRCLPASVARTNETERSASPPRRNSRGASAPRRVASSSSCVSTAWRGSCT